jgi:DNA invertase Pin-like site-specific DNA recombinase
MAKKVTRQERNKLAMRRARRRARGLPEDAPLNAGRRGEFHPSAKLTEKDIEKVRQMREAGHTVTELAERFGVSKSTMSAALARKTWRR